MAGEERRRLLEDAAAQRLRGDALELMLARIRVRQLPVSPDAGTAEAEGGGASQPAPASAATEEASAEAAAVAGLAPVASALAGLGPAGEVRGLESDDEEEACALSAEALVLEGCSYLGEDAMALLKVG